MQGRVAYTDPRVRRVFDRWRDARSTRLLQPKPRIVELAGEPGAALQGKAAMMLIGNYIVPNFPPEVRERMDFARVPRHDPAGVASRTRPMNTIHVAARRAQQGGRKRFPRLRSARRRAGGHQSTHAADSRQPEGRHCRRPLPRTRAGPCSPAPTALRNSSTATPARTSPISR